MMVQDEHVTLFNVFMLDENLSAKLIHFWESSCKSFISFQINTFSRAVKLERKPQVVLPKGWHAHSSKRLMQF